MNEGRKERTHHNSYFQNILKQQTAILLTKTQIIDIIEAFTLYHKGIFLLFGAFWLQQKHIKQKLIQIDNLQDCAATVWTNQRIVTWKFISI